MSRYGNLGDFQKNYGFGPVVKRGVPDPIPPRKVARKAVRKRVPKPKPVVPEPKKPDPFRAEWFVHATKGKTTVDLACAEGEAEAHRAVETMKGHGWTDVYAHVKNVPRGDGRFHQNS